MSSNAIFNVLLHRTWRFFRVGIEFSQNLSVYYAIYPTVVSQENESSHLQ